MNAEQLRSIIAAGLPCTHLEVDGDGRHWSAVVVSEAFAGLRLIARHQKVYATLGQKNPDRRGTCLVDENIHPCRMGGTASLNDSRTWIN